MNQYKIKHSFLKGIIHVPPSKSHTLRAILFGALGDGKTIVHEYLSSPDAWSMIEACRLLGSHIQIYPDRLEIEGLKGRVVGAEDVINAGNSGLVLRFIASMAALGSKPIVITGDHSIRHQRPMKPLLEAFHQLHVSAISTRDNGYAPVIIQGPLKWEQQIEVSGEDSQPVSALLMAAIFTEGPKNLMVRHPGEKPWISLTLDWLDRLGVKYENDNFHHYQVHGIGSYKGFNYTIPGDLSSAAFPIAAALVTQSEIELKNVNLKDCQGDKQLIEVFQKMGAQIEVDEENQSLHVKKNSSLKGLEVDINDFIDGITILAVVACFSKGETRITNASIARQKECNRIHCIATELKKMGADIIEYEDGLTIRSSQLRGTTVYSYQDHRMAMSLAIAGMGATGETQIHSVECVSKTFPSFVKDFNELGASIEVLP